MSISLHDDLDDYMRDLQPCQQFDSGCEIEGGVVQLLYWQPEKIVGDLCDTECVNSNANATSSSSFPWDEGYNSTGLCAACSGKRTVVMTSADADIVTAVYDGHTLTSPTVYYSFDSLWTVRGDVWIGTETLYNQVVPVDPAEVSTFACNAYGGYGGPSEPMNWADLASPAPANVYCCIATGPGDRPTIYGDFNPTLAFPSQVKGLDPEWSTCGLFVGISDPPYALTGTSVAASPEDPFTTTQGEIRTGFLQPTPNSWRPPPGPSAIMRPPTISPTALSATYPAKSNSPQTLDSGPTGAAIGGDSSHRWNSPSSAVEFPPPQEQGHTKIGGFKSQQHPLADSSNQSPSFVLDISGIIESDPGRHQSMDSDVRLPEGNSMQGANSPVYMSQDSVSQYHGESGRSPGNIIVKMFGLQAGNADPHDGAGSGNGDGAQAWQGKPSRLPFDPPSSHLGSSQTGEEIEMAIDSSGIADNPSENTDSHGHSHDGSAATDPSSDAAAEDTTHQNSNEGGTGAGEMASMAPDPASYNKPSSDFQSDWSGSLGTSSEDNTGAEPVESGQKVTQAILAIDGKFVTAFEVMDPFGNPEMVLGGRTLALGTTLVTGGTTISAAASGIVEEAEGKTSLVPWQTRPPQISEAVITLEGKRVTATEEFGPSGSAKIVLDGSTFLVGQTFSKGDALINAGASGITEIVGGKTSIIPWQAAGLEFTEVVLSLNGLPITAVQQRDAFGRTEVVIGGQTLHFGDVVTIDGTTLSIESSAIVEIDTKKATTIPWQVADPTTAHSLTPGPTDDSVSTKSLQTASAPSHVVRKAFGLSCIFTSILLLSI
ncbi:hypothetical protein EV356DRAFT_506622 [Viridothelium virens]|uniref:Uncharacterized protein n=1 Tax=Viridothelium virens TaxID=1048519 RepID=A0A6A6H169_VIRVR|nr:hypothetical protein EV356DRAFT_506622 [Viridothelium virens]